MKKQSMDGRGFLSLFALFAFTANAFAIDFTPDVTACAPGDAVSGLDVSNFDPGTNWTAVQKAGNGFAFIKATEGVSVINKDFASDWPAALNAGLIRGPYHYFHPNIDPTRQANVFLSTVGTLGANDLPALLDWEITGGETSAIQIQRALVWLSLVESATGKIPMIYVNPSFWKALGDTSAFARYPLFIANYDVSCPAIPAPWSTWTFWQQGIGPIDGVKANAVDLDVFNGSNAQLQAFAQQ